MNNLWKLVIGLMALTSFAMADTASKCNEYCGEDGNEALAVVDVVLVRPVTFVGTSVGFVLFAASSPFTAMGGVAQDSWDVLVQKPADYTLDRGLGNFR